MRTSLVKSLQLIVSLVQSADKKRLLAELCEDLPAKVKLKASCSSNFILNFIGVGFCPFTIYHQANLPILFVLDRTMEIYRTSATQLTGSPTARTSDRLTSTSYNFHH